MDRFAPPLALVGRVLGRPPVQVDLHAASSRWTVLVFEPDADARRLYELASVRGNFTAEHATLLVVCPTPAEWAERDIPVVHDPGNAIRDAFGTSGAATVVVAPDGLIWYAVSGPAGERHALEFIAGVRTGAVRPALAIARAA